MNTVINILFNKRGSSIIGVVVLLLIATAALVIIVNYGPQWGKLPAKKTAEPKTIKVTDLKVGYQQVNFRDYQAKKIVVSWDRSGDKDCQTRKALIPQPPECNPKEKKKGWEACQSGDIFLHILSSDLRVFPMDAKCDPRCKYKQVIDEKVGLVDVYSLCGKNIEVTLN